MGPVRCKKRPEGELSQPVAEKLLYSISKVFALHIIHQASSLGELLPEEILRCAFTNGMDGPELGDQWGAF